MLKPYFEDTKNGLTIYCGDCLTILSEMPSESVDCCITSPPYWGLRNYNVEGQYGLEKTPEEYVAKIVKVFGEVKRVLKKEGTCWCNLGDSYTTQHKTGTTDKAKGWTSATGIGNRQLEHGRAGSSGLPSKNLVGIPWRIAFALQADGWILRQDIIWHKPNPMPESVTDRCTKAHEYIFLLAKSQKYYFDNEAIKEPVVRVWDEKNGGNLKRGGKRIVGNNITQNHNTEYPKCDGERNKRSVWTVSTKPFKGAHFATFPEDLILPCVLAGCPKNGIILDPFSGAGTTGVVAKKNNRNFIGIELNEKYCEITVKRLQNTQASLF